MEMTKRILYVEDSDDLRELTSFLFQAHFQCQVVEASDAKKAIEVLKRDNNFDLIISDFNMPGGDGDEVYTYLHQNKMAIPFLILSGNSLSSHPVLSQVKCYLKPMSEDEVIQMVRDNLTEIRPTDSKSYVPVAVSLLKKIRDLNCTLYVKINDEKFVKLFHKGVALTDAELARHSQHGIATLYIDAEESDTFIADYRRKILAGQAWQEAENDDFEDGFKLNAELLRNMGQLLKQNHEFIALTVAQVETALKVVSKNKKFNHLVQRFRKIENFGFSDHCTSLVYVAGYVLSGMSGIDVEQDLRMVTLAALLHDVSLDDRLYEMKLNLLFSNRLKNLENGSRDQQEIWSHTRKGAALAKDFDFCPRDVQFLIAEHHELPDGSGFPAGLRADQIHPLSAVFIVAEDFVDYFIRHSPAPDWKSFVKTRESVYVHGEFARAFQSLKRNIG